MSKTYLESGEVALLERNAVTWAHLDGRWVEAVCLRDRLLIRLLFRTGVRVSEAVSLRVEDVDLKQGVLRVIRQKERLRLFCPDCSAHLGRSHRFCPGCGREVARAVMKAVEARRVRTLPLDAETVEMLREFVEKGGPRAKGGQLLLFPISRNQAWRVVHQAARRAGLGRLVHPETGKEHGVSPHRLRDAFAMRAVAVDDSGDGMRLLQQHLGHQSFNTTARYLKYGGKEQREWLNRLWQEGADG